MNNKLPIPFLILSVPIVLGMTQFVPDDEPLTLLFMLSAISILLSLRPVKYFTDVVFYMLFEITSFLSIYLYSTLFLDYFLPKIGMGDYEILGLDLSFYLGLLSAFILSIVLIITYHNHRNEKKKTFEISFSIVLAAISNINIFM